MNQTTTPSPARIAALNDRCRADLGGSGRMIRTAGVAALPHGEQLAIFGKVAAFNAFEGGDDPYEERDFGSFEHAGERIFWKIDYYGPSMEGASDDPGDPAKTVRVLTIMLASEY